MIRFNRSCHPNFSNFAPYALTYDGIEYLSSEAAWQAQKDVNPVKRAFFSKVDPKTAKRMGRISKMRSDWEEVKYQLMVDVCYVKFSQNPELRKELLSTGDEEIIEDTTPRHDNEWGDCRCSRCAEIEGKNKLGKALMEVRTKLRNN